MQRPTRTFLYAVFGLLTSALLLVSAPPVVAQQAPPDLDAAIPLADEVRTGTLDNGLRYYIRQNDEPENRLQLRLAINAGSILETDAQLGLAHFLEHMLFNGTENFPEDELVSFLERTGMDFGADINAYTSYDETVYKLQVPTDSADLVETSFTVLRDWASRATLSEEEIDKERGVVVEEFRLRLENARGRYFLDELLPKRYYNSRYADRLPIGDTTVVRNAPYAEVRDFYNTWYRPDLTTIVAVGDMDPDQLETLIRDRFADWEGPDNPQPRETYNVPDHEETLFSLFTDPEFTTTTVGTSVKADNDPMDTVSDYRMALVERVAFGIMNARLNEKVQSGTVPMLGAGAGRSNYLRSLKGYSLQAQVPEDSVLAGFEALLTEAVRVQQHGFTESELTRQKQDVLRGLESAYAERENIPSNRMATEYVQLALAGNAAPSVEYEYETAQSLLPSIDLADVNAVAEKLLADENRLIFTQMPEKEGLELPTEDELAGVLERVREKDVAPYEDTASDIPLMAEIPEPASVTSTETVEELGVTKWTLENGVTVIHKPTDFKDDEIQVRASSPGGLSTIDDAVFPQLRFTSSIVNQSGVGPFDRAALEKYLQGKSVSVNPYIGGSEEGFRGSASPEDLETLFQLIHMYATAPRADEAALQSFKKQQVAQLQNRMQSPFIVFQDSLNSIVFDNHPRRSIPSVAAIEAIEREPLLDFYRERFGDVSDFTFTFVGNVSPDSLAPFVQRYLGTLPAEDGEDPVRAVTPGAPDDVVRAEVKTGQSQRSLVVLQYNGPMEYTRENRHRLSTLSEVLSIKLREELREKRSGTYGVQVQTSSTGAPYDRYNFVVLFFCEPSRAEPLLQAAQAEIDSVRNGEVSADVVAKVTAKQTESRETSLEENGFWVSALDFAYTTEGADPLDITRYDELVESVTPESVAETAAEYLNDDRYVLGILYPEDFEATSETSESMEDEAVDGGPGEGDKR